MKKSVSSRQQKSKTGKLNPNRAAGEGQGQAGLQIQQAPFWGHKSTENLSAETSSPQRREEGKDGDEQTLKHGSRQIWANPRDCCVGGCAVTAEHRGSRCRQAAEDSGQHRLTLAIGPAGEKLASPRHVRFAAEMAHHLLRWEPGHSPPGDVRYEVELKV